MASASLNFMTINSTTSTSSLSSVKCMTYRFNSTNIQPKKPYSRCSYCSKKFEKPSALKAHVYSHTGEKPHRCQNDGCKRSFSLASNLRRHMKIHARKQSTKSSITKPLINQKIYPNNFNNRRKNEFIFPSSISTMSSSRLSVTSSPSVGKMDPYFNGSTGNDVLNVYPIQPDNNEYKKSDVSREAPSYALLDHIPSVPASIIDETDIYRESMSPSDSSELATPIGYGTNAQNASDYYFDIFVHQNSTLSVDNDQPPPLWAQQAATHDWISSAYDTSILPEMMMTTVTVPIRSLPTSENFRLQDPSIHPYHDRPQQQQHHYPSFTQRVQPPPFREQHPFSLFDVTFSQLQL